MPQRNHQSMQRIHLSQLKTHVVSRSGEELIRPWLLMLTDPSSRLVLGMDLIFESKLNHASIVKALNDMMEKIEWR